MRTTASPVTKARGLLIALAIGTAAFTGACGDEGPASAPPSQAAPAPTSAAPAGPSKDQTDIIAVIQQYQLAVDKGDATAACALMTKDLQFVYSQDPGSGNCVKAIENLHDSLGETKLANTRVFPKDVDVKGTMATLSRDKIAKANGLKPDQAESYDMIKADGKWLIDYIS